MSVPFTIKIPPGNYNIIKTDEELIIEKDSNTQVDTTDLSYKSAFHQAQNNDEPLRLFVAAKVSSTKTVADNSTTKAHTFLHKKRIAPVNIPEITDDESSDEEMLKKPRKE